MPGIKDAMLAAPIPVQKIETPEWPDLKHVHVRKLDGVLLAITQQLIERYERERAQRTIEANGQMSDTQFIYELFIIFVCDENGDAVFSASDKASIMNLLFAPVERCVNAGLEFNHMTEEAAKEVRGKSKGVRRGKPG